MSYVSFPRLPNTPPPTPNEGIGPPPAGLEAIRILKLGDRTRFYQASTSELYGLVQEVPQRETLRRSILGLPTPRGETLPPAGSLSRNYREAYGLHASNGISVQS